MAYSSISTFLFHCQNFYLLTNSTDPISTSIDRSMLRTRKSSSICNATNPSGSNKSTSGQNASEQIGSIDRTRFECGSPLTGDNSRYQYGTEDEKQTAQAFVPISTLDRLFGASVSSNAGLVVSIVRFTNDYASVEQHLGPGL